MRRTLSLLLSLALILSGSCLISCKEERIPDREYDPALVLEVAAELVAKSWDINLFFWGTGIPVSEEENAVKIGKYTEADKNFTEQMDLKTIDDLKKMTSEVYDKAFCEVIFSTKLASLKDTDGNMVSLVRYYQNISTDEDGNEVKGPIMVHTEAEVYFDETPIYHYDSLSILGVEGEIVHLLIDASFASSPDERITVPVDLIEEEDGWRLVSPTYVAKPKK